MCGVVPTREQAVEIARRVMFSIMWTCTKRLEAFVDSLVVLGLFKRTSSRVRRKWLPVL